MYLEEYLDDPHTGEEQRVWVVHSPVYLAGAEQHGRDCGVNYIIVDDKWLSQIHRKPLHVITDEPDQPPCVDDYLYILGY
jgi:hypothetical protein